MTHTISSGTAILLTPGIIAGGSVTHDCPLSRSIGYFLEPAVMLAPFSKKPLHLTLRGITSNDQDLSVRFQPEYFVLLKVHISSSRRT